jgi:hypothetical protein
MFGLLNALMWASLLQPPVPHIPLEPTAPGERGWADPLLYRDMGLDAWKQCKSLEAVEMFSAICQGSGMGPGQGWFHDSSCKYHWKTFARQLGLEGEKTIKRKQFPGPLEWFDRLDRNRDGKLTPEDFDYSDKLPSLNPAQFATVLMNAMDTDGDGEISPAEWEAFFKQACNGDETLSMMGLVGGLKSATKRMMNSDGPSPALLVSGILKGDLGSMCEGPKLGEQGPDFSLKTQDGKRTIKLSDYRGKKPVVLIFGSFS